MKTILQKIIVVSKYALIGLLAQTIVFSVLFADNSRAQNKIKSISIDDVYIKVNIQGLGIEEIFSRIEQKTDFKFAYRKSIIDQNITFEENSKANTIGGVLRIISKNANLEFRRVNDVIHVKRSEDNTGTGITEFIQVAQDRTITGRVTSEEDGSAIPGVNILIKGTSRGTITDSNGNYAIDISTDDAVLIFSAVGFIRQEVEIGSKSVQDLVMKTDVAQLEELVVVGYGVQKKSDVTGTVASLPKERLEMAPNLDITQAIQGAIPGVMIHTVTAGARPEQTILVRGRNSITANNDPLIIVDGIPYEGPISDINPYDVESIEVLKDASAAAIYGSRGANGVILITTKEGEEGKPVFSYDGRYSVLDVTKVSRQLTGPEFYDFKMTRNAAAMTLSEQEVYDNGTWTDWVDLALRTGQEQEHNLSVSGGFNKTRYYVGAGYTDIQGVAKNDDYKRFSTRVNVESKLTDWLTIGTRSRFTQSDASGDEVNFEVALETNPLGLAYDEYGNYTIFPWPDNIIVGNPLGHLLYDDLDKSYHASSNNYVVVDFPFVKGLTYRLNTGIRMRFTDRARYEGRDTQSGLADLGDASISNSVSNSAVVENILSYNREFGQHTVFLTGLYSYEGDKRRTNGLDATKFPNDFLSWYGAAQAANVFPENTYNETSLVSQMLRVNYSYASRYLLTLTVRRDGYSGFGTDNKWGTFPSAAVGWNLANESFFPFKNVLNELKIRASYGMNGNQAIGAYESLSQFIVANYSSGSQTVIGYKPSKMGVADLGWESSKILNLGFDFGLFDDRITGSFNWYHTNTYDLLLNRSISVVHGITSNTHLPHWIHPNVTENIGKTENKGIELVVTSRNLVGNKFKWTTTGNLSFNKNKIVSLYGMVDEEGNEIDDISNKWFIGEPIDVNYDFVWDGVWQLDEEAEAAEFGQKPGYAKLKDLNGDGELTADDREIIGQNDPKLLWGLTNVFSYGKFGLSIFMYGVHGRTTMNYLMNDQVQGAEVRYNTLKKNWWTPDNPTNDWVKNEEFADHEQGYAANIYENSNYIRIKDISLSYDLPTDLVNKVNIRRLRVYVTGRNLLTFTKWTGMDPALVDEDSQQQIPMQKEYVFGLNLSF